MPSTRFRSAHMGPMRGFGGAALASLSTIRIARSTGQEKEEEEEEEEEEEGRREVSGG